MGVTNRNEVHYKRPDHLSSTESLHIPISSSQSSLISAPSVENIPRIPVRRQKRHKAVSESPVASPRNAGRRRQRRFKAVAELSALIEEEESDIFLEEGIPHNSPFATIVDNPELGHIWEQFTTDDENKQAELMNDLTTVSLKPKSAVASYTNVSFHVKMTFKMMRSVYELKKTEEEILNFFINTPDDVYVNNNKSSYQRLLIHGVAQYYCFKSTSFNTEDGKRTIKVENPHNYRDFNHKRLCSIVQDNHKTRI